jgi:Tfp pilus assembly major pilin PilA
MGGSMSGMMPILVIIAIAAIGIPIYLKIKKNKTANSAISKRRSKDEV